MSVVQEQKVAKRVVRSSADILRTLKIEYACEWPLEIVIDKQTIIRKYNLVFKLLV
jgi:hypothetical protein